MDFAIRWAAFSFFDGCLAWGLMVAAHTYLESPFYLGDLYIDPSKNLVQFLDDTRNIQPQLMNVLSFLCAHAGSVVSADALLEACWPDQYISDSPIHKCIAQLRKTLKDTSKNPRYIKTVPRKGYMVVAKVSGVAGEKVSAGPYWTERSPFPGAKAYSEADRDVFFGREQVVADLLEWSSPWLSSLVEGEAPISATSRLPWLSLSGSSGCGKTSVMQAGLLPVIANRNREAEATRLPCFYLDMNKGTGASVSTVILEFLCQHKILPASLSFDRYKEVFEQWAEPGSKSSALFLEHLGRGLAALSSGFRTILFIDHLEQIFDETDVSEYQSCLALLDTLLATGKCLLISAVQERYTPQLEQFSPRYGQAFQYGIPGFSKSEVIDIIQKPAEAAGLLFDYNTRTRERLDTFLIHNQQVNPVPLAILQRLLVRLYDRRKGNELTYAALYEVGGFGGCMGDVAEQTYQALSIDMQGRFNALLYNLIAVNPTGDAVMIAAPVAAESFSPLIQKKLFLPFVEAGVFLERDNKGDPSICLAHDSLLTHWDRLREWINASISEFYFRHDIKIAAERWVFHDKHNSFLLESPGSIKQAKALLAERDFRLTDNEYAFVEACEKKAAGTRRLKAGLAGCLIGFIVSLGWLSFSLQQQSDKLSTSRANAENLISAILHDLKDKLEPLGKLELLEIIGSKAKAYFDSSGTQNLSENALVQWANSLIIMGQVHAEKMEYEEALNFFGESRDVINRALIRYPDHIGLLEQSMLANYWMGFIPFRQKDYAEAEIFFQRYFEIATSLQRLQPDNRNWQIEVSYALNNLGSLAEKTNRFAIAAELFEKSAAIKERLLEHDQGNLSLRSDLADTLSWQASVLERTGGLLQSLLYRKRALDHGYIIQETQPGNFKWFRRVATLEHRIAITYYDAGDVPAAEMHSLRALENLQKLVTNDPVNNHDKTKLFWSYLLLSRVMRHQGQNDQSLVYLNRAGDLNPAGSKSDVTIHSRVALLRERAIVYAHIGQKQSALAAIERALAQFGGAQPLPVENQFLFAELMLTKMNLLKVLSLPVEEGFSQSFMDVRAALSPLLTEQQLEPKYHAIYQGMAKYGQPAETQMSFSSSPILSEYRNPDFFMEIALGQ